MSINSKNLTIVIYTLLGCAGVYFIFFGAPIASDSDTIEPSQTKLEKARKVDQKPILASSRNQEIETTTAKAIMYPIDRYYTTKNFPASKLIFEFETRAKAGSILAQSTLSNMLSYCANSPTSISHLAKLVNESDGLDLRSETLIDMHSQCLDAKTKFVNLFDQAELWREEAADNGDSLSLLQKHFYYGGQLPKEKVADHIRRAILESKGNFILEAEAFSMARKYLKDGKRVSELTLKSLEYLVCDRQLYCFTGRSGHQNAMPGFPPYDLDVVEHANEIEKAITRGDTDILDV